MLKAIILVVIVNGQNYFVADFEKEKQCANAKADVQEITKGTVKVECWVRT
jgi:hypothetical protein